jgi:hypothetical protein
VIENAALGSWAAAEESEISDSRSRHADGSIVAGFTMGAIASVVPNADPSAAGLLRFVFDGEFLNRTFPVQFLNCPVCIQNDRCSARFMCIAASALLSALIVAASSIIILYQLVRSKKLITCDLV